MLLYEQDVFFGVFWDGLCVHVRVGEGGSVLCVVRRRASSGGTSYHSW